MSQATGSPPAPGGNNARKRRALAVFGVVALSTLAAGGYYWWYRQWHVTTDDAYVEGRIHTVSSRVRGKVVEVAVDDNQPVKRGDPLLRIDPEPYAVRVEQAASALAGARADRKAAEADREAARQDLAAATAQRAQAEVAVEAARSRVALAEARQAQAERDFLRAKNLFDQQSISRERYERAQTERDVARAQLSLAREELRLAGAALPSLDALISQKQAALAQREARIGQQESLVRQREAALAEARLNRDDTVVTAPVDGYVTRKSVEPGEVVDEGQALLAVASLDDVWVVANYKETQITRFRPGQEVVLRVDTFPGRKLTGRIESIMAGTGSAFSLFPPQNASGNYVKVVQRVPVKIRIESGQDPDRILRIGMSVIPTVLIR